jgi:nucleotide-binding universal stress UspA family protein
MTHSGNGALRERSPAVTRVLAVVVAAGRPDAAVLGAAEALAAVVRGDVRVIPVAAGSTLRDAVALIVTTLADVGDLSFVVVGRDDPVPSMWLPLARRIEVPVMIVPPGGQPPHGALERLLIPLDGSVEAAAAVDESVEMFAGAGAELIVLHVFDSTTVPHFWDQAAHAAQAWEDEFVARFARRPGTRLAIRHGGPGEHICEVAGAEQVDLIVLGWSPNPSGDRARTVQATVQAASVPVMLASGASRLAPAPARNADRR